MKKAASVKSDAKAAEKGRYGISNPTAKADRKRAKAGGKEASNGTRPTEERLASRKKTTMHWVGLTSTASSPKLNRRFGRVRPHWKEEFCCRHRCRPRDGPDERSRISDLIVATLHRSATHDLGLRFNEQRWC